MGILKMWMIQETLPILEFKMLNFQDLLRATKIFFYITKKYR